MDHQYWNKYYNQNIAPTKPSAFAIDILGYLKQGNKLVELGCGNGRDSILFSEKGIDVVAIDQSEQSINNLKAKYCKNGINFIADDFIETKFLEEKEFHYAYSRFTIHSISEQEEDKLVKRVYSSLKDQGLFFIEVRSVKDDIYGLGEQVGRNTYIYNDHTRRFVVMEELVEKLKLEGFKIVLADEDKNYAIHKEENPIVIRIIAEK